MLLGAAILLVILSIMSCTIKQIQKRKAQQTVQIGKEETGEKTGKNVKIKTNDEPASDTAEEYLEKVRQKAKEEGYPKEIIGLLKKNEETAEFVENYGQKKDIPPSDSVGKVKKGKIPLLLQWDERWGYAPYGTSTIAVSGCGPTCMSMVLTGLTGDASITPAKVAAYGTKHEYVDESNDTLWTFMEQASQNWNISCSEINPEETVVASELSKGHPIICSVGPGDFTRRGHFIILVDYDDGKVTIRDPFSQKNSDKIWKYEDIVDQFQAMWVYY